MRNKPGGRAKLEEVHLASPKRPICIQREKGAVVAKSERTRKKRHFVAVWTSPFAICEGSYNMSLVACKRCVRGGMKCFCLKNETENWSGGEKYTVEKN